MNEQEILFGRLFPLLVNQHDSAIRKKGLQQLRQLAEEGFAPAQFSLGIAYIDHIGVQRDYQQAFEYISQAARQEYPPALAWMGIFYATAYPKYGVVPLDKAEACRWWEKAARLGNCGAQYNLAVACRQGSGVEQSYRQAYIWASLAVHCSPIPFTAARAEVNQTLPNLSELARNEADREIEQLKQGLPRDDSEHLVYWEKCARAAG